MATCLEWDEDASEVTPERSASQTSKSQANDCPIYRLPREIMVRIFRYFEPFCDSLPILACVCKKWRKLLQETPSLWRRVHVRAANKQDSHDSDMLSAIFITYGHHIQQLVWDQTARISESAFYLIPSLSELTVLSLPITWNRTVVEALSPLSQLIELAINGGFDLLDEDLLLVAVQFPLLKRVTVSACWAITWEGIKGFTACLKDLEDCNIKINNGLPVEDARSDRAMIEGHIIARDLAELPRAAVVTSLTVNLVPIEVEELWGAVLSLQHLKKLTVCNCERLHGVRLTSMSLQKLTLHSLWSSHFVSITAPSLRRLRIDHGMESCEHLEVYANKLKTMAVDGNDALRFLAVRSSRLSTVEIRNCPNLTLSEFQSFLKNNSTISSLMLGAISAIETYIEPSWCPRLQSLTIQPDFRSRVLSIRCPTLEHLHVVSEGSELSEQLEEVILVANHLKTVSLCGMLSLRNLYVQCNLLDSLLLDTTNDVMISLRSCTIHAHRVLGNVKLCDCSLGALVVFAPSVETLVLYRCFLQNYTMQMALVGCSFISHLCIERCLSLTQFHVPPSVEVRYLNLYGCQRLRFVNIDSPNLQALNLGQCYKAELTCEGKKIDYDKEVPWSDGITIVAPRSFIKWTHTEVPSSYQTEFDVS